MTRPDDGKLRVLVTGSAGQVGGAVRAHAPAAVVVHAFDSTVLDIGDAGSVAAAFSRVQPDVVINAAAYTAVDRAETEPAAAFRVNHAGVANLAAATVQHGGRLIHISTDFVFDGERDTPYPVDAACRPLSVYGASKRAGEEAVLALGGQGAVIRSSWVYAARGKNFVRTMLQLMRHRQDVRVVADQTGRPTWASGLAEAIWATVSQGEVSGVLHWADAGQATWYELASAIRSDGEALGLVPPGCVVVPVSTAEFPTPARRPRYSVLDTTRTTDMLGLAPVPWRDNLRLMLEEACQEA